MDEAASFLQVPVLPVRGGDLDPDILAQVASCQSSWQLSTLLQLQVVRELRRLNESLAHDDDDDDDDWREDDD